MESAALVEDIIEATLRREVLEEAGVTLAEEVHYVRSKTFITNDG